MGARVEIEEDIAKLLNRLVKKDDDRRLLSDWLVSDDVMVVDVEDFALLASAADSVGASIMVPAGFRECQSAIRVQLTKLWTACRSAKSKSDGIAAPPWRKTMSWSQSRFGTPKKERCEIRTLRCSL